MLLICLDYWIWEKNNHDLKMTLQKKIIIQIKTSRNKPTTELQ
jgi:hypothetical protein